MKLYIKASAMSLLLFICTLAFFPNCISAKEKPFVLGDTDGDEIITITDCTTIQRDVAGLVEIQSKDRNSADIDLDGEVCILDATHIQRWLARMDMTYPIGQGVTISYLNQFYGYQRQETEVSNEELPTVIVNGNVITIDDNTFDTKYIPDKATISNANTNSKTLILTSKADLSPQDITIQINNGMFEYKTDYMDMRYKESYLMAKSGKMTAGYDCLVSNETGEPVAWVEAHYCDGWSDPFRVKIYGLKASKYTFPVEFFYKGVSIKRCEVTVSLPENTRSIENTINTVLSIENQCWTPKMTLQEKLQVFSKYVAEHYSYAQVYCNIGADYVALAARDLGLESMLLYPGGEQNPSCDRPVVTYNIYMNYLEPGGHCACLVEYPDGLILRYDVQGGNYWIRQYNN